MDKVMSLSVNIVKLGLDLILKNFTTILEVKNYGGLESCVQHFFQGNIDFCGLCLQVIGSGWAVSYPLTEE